MFTLAFWKATTERVVASFVGALLALLGGNTFDITALDWGQLLKISAGAALVSLLKAVLAATTTGGGPSLTNSETLTDKVAAVEARNTPDASRPDLVAGPAADVPEDTPVEVVPAVGDGLGTAITNVADTIYASDPKTDATYTGRGE